MIKEQKLLLGAHMSIAEGFEKAIEYGESIGCTAIQIFTKNNRRWNAKKITKEDSQKFKIALKNSSIKFIVAHASYLINIGSPKRKHKKSVDALVKELNRCEKLGIPYLVIHPGSCLKTNEQECLDIITQNLDIALEKAHGKTMILLETMAGQGSSTCYTFEHIAYIIKKSKKKKRLGVCFDTCHVFAAGYDLRDKKSYVDTWKKFEKTIGIRKLKVIHINDSKKELGSRVDRHEHIGKGKLGSQAFKLLLTDKRFSNIPKILETPKETLEEDAHNMAFIKKLIKT